MLVAVFIVVMKMLPAPTVPMLKPLALLSRTPFIFSGSAAALIAARIELPVPIPMCLFNDCDFFSIKSLLLFEIMDNGNCGLRSIELGMEEHREDKYKR